MNVQEYVGGVAEGLTYTQHPPLIFLMAPLDFYLPLPTPKNVLNPYPPPP